MSCTKVSPACDGCYAEALMDKGYTRYNGATARVSAPAPILGMTRCARKPQHTDEQESRAPSQRNSGVGADAPRSAQPYVVRTFPTSFTCPCSSR
nr:phage Gp37/Gp68 family protein [Ensifer adhaerens]